MRDYILHCPHCKTPVNARDYEEIPDEDISFFEGRGTFKAWYTCPKCKQFFGGYFGLKVSIEDVDYYGDRGENLGWENFSPWDITANL